LLNGVAAQAIHTHVIPHSLVFLAHHTPWCAQLARCTVGYCSLSSTQLSHVERLCWSVYGAFVVERGQALHADK